MKAHKLLKEEYKQRKFKIGVFQIRNTQNGKVLIGSSLNLDAIWNRNKMELNFGTHRNEELQKEWKEFGMEKFVFEVLGEIEQKDDVVIDLEAEVKTLEAMYIEERKPFDGQGYNVKRI